MKQQPISINLSSEKMLSHTLFLQREYAISHLPYDQELTFYDTVRRGDIKTLEKIMLSLDDEKLGKLSENPLNNQKYHLIVTIALITRFCIEGGLPAETAYTLSDLYIQRLDVCKSIDELRHIHKQVTFDFAKRMKKIQDKPLLSKSTLQAIDYIYINLQDRLTLDDVASKVKLNKTYFCKLFKQETGFTISKYITKLKIEAAANMLIYTDYSEISLANYFAFSSLSHFINVFKSIMGVTPKEYRKSNYRAHFSPSKGSKIKFKNKDKEES